MVRGRLDDEDAAIICVFNNMLIEEADDPFFVADTSALPCEKDRILTAYMRAISNSSDKDEIAGLSVLVTSLAKYQPGVGDNPIRMPDAAAIQSMPVGKDSWPETVALMKLVQEWSPKIIDNSNKIIRMVTDATKANCHVQPIHIKIWRIIRRGSRNRVA